MTNLFLIRSDALNTSSNAIDRWFIKLPELFDGFGMVIYVVLTLLISGILSSVIGLERYRMGENAGLRTHALLSIGSSFLMTISIWAIRVPVPSLEYDISRIAAAAVTGIGFLGAGVIIKDRFTVKGLSTATTLWICAAIGLANGAGFVFESIIATAITILVVIIRNKAIIIVDRNAPHAIIVSKANGNAIERVIKVCNINGFNLKNVNITDMNDETVTLKAYFPYHVNPFMIEYFMKEMLKDENTISVRKVMKKEKHFDDSHEG